MNLLRSNIVDLWKNGKTICVTTNGFVKKNGCGVMGRGNALAMSKELPMLPKLLGNFIKTFGNSVGFIYKESIISFPVKPTQGNYENVLPHIANRYKPTDVIPGFWCKASLPLIQSSVNQLNELIIKNKLEEVYLPLPGCSNGGLSIEDVEPIISNCVTQVKFVSYNY